MNFTFPQMTIPSGHEFEWKRFKCQEAELLIKQDEAEKKGDTNELIKIKHELYDLVRAWMEQLMIWGADDEQPEVNDIYWELRGAQENGTKLPDTKNWK